MLKAERTETAKSCCLPICAERCSSSCCSLWVRCVQYQCWSWYQREVPITSQVRSWAKPVISQQPMHLLCLGGVYSGIIFQGASKESWCSLPPQEGRQLTVCYRKALTLQRIYSSHLKTQKTNKCCSRNSLMYILCCSQNSCSWMTTCSRSLESLIFLLSYFPFHSCLIKNGCEKNKIWCV